MKAKYNYVPGFTAATINLLLVTGVFNFFSCQQSSEGFDITADQYINLADKSDITLLDVRTSGEYQSGHLDNAILINIYASDFMEKIKTLDKTNTYYVYCRTGARSRSAVKKMRQLGISNAYNLKGGISQLTRKGVKLVK